MTTSFYDEDELKTLGLKFIGKNVLISRKASIYGAENIVIGDNVRIDDFCILSGNITFKNNIHLAAYSALYGGTAGINIDSFSNISSRVCVYAISDDYSGCFMTNPTIPEKYKHTQNEPVVLEKHVIIGSGSIVLPGVVLKEGTALGAMTLCKKTTDPWSIYFGIPARFYKKREKKILDIEKILLNEDEDIE